MRFCLITQTHKQMCVAHGYNEKHIPERSDHTEQPAFRFGAINKCPYTRMVLEVHEARTVHGLRDTRCRQVNVVVRYECHSEVPRPFWPQQV